MLEEVDGEMEQLEEERLILAEQAEKTTVDKPTQQTETVKLEKDPSGSSKDEDYTGTDAVDTFLAEQLEAETQEIEKQQAAKSDAEMLMEMMSTEPIEPKSQEQRAMETRDSAVGKSLISSDYNTATN